jgi:hypothetical protein
MFHICSIRTKSQHKTAANEKKPLAAHRFGSLAIGMAERKTAAKTLAFASKAD